ncbi:hypothetical protein [Virgifigura deserti]|uniref:hypothetical protein n=1 Tax=Virgifigura deserti TaxID=2268457 RepID=UPI003CCB74AA
MPKDIAHAITELIADLGDPVVRRPAVRARITAILDERDLSIGRAENMIGCLVHRTIEPIASHRLRHAKTSSSHWTPRHSASGALCRTTDNGVRVFFGVTAAHSLNPGDHNGVSVSGP